MSNSTEPVCNVLLRIADNYFDREVEIKSDLDLQDSILVLQMIRLTNLDQSIKTMADLHAQKVVHNFVKLS